jgi:DNA-binding CsgD family transcriptional regulator
LVTGGHAAAVATLQRAATALTSLPVEDVVRWGWAGTAASDAVWDNEGTRAIAERNTRLVRSVGALAHLPVVVAALGNAAILSGDFAGAASLIAEAEAIGAATGTRFAPYTALRLLAVQGKETEANDLIAATLEGAAAHGQGLAAKNAHWAAAVLCNSLGRYHEAVSAARLATSEPFEPFVSMWALPELVEAAARSGDAELAREAVERLAATTQPCGTDFGLGIEARCRALLGVGPVEDLYHEAIGRLGRAGLRPDRARAQLLYGEWLRREGRRVDARGQLRTAHDMFADVGMQAFRERAGRELIATGERVRKRNDDTRGQLTPQEEQIARLARDGLTNSEIGAMLFLSPRTVEWHLRKVFTKLGISSRNGLRAGMPRIAGEPTLV